MSTLLWSIYAFAHSYKRPLTFPARARPCAVLTAFCYDHSVWCQYPGEKQKRAGEAKAKYYLCQVCILYVSRLITKTFTFGRKDVNDRSFCLHLRPFGQGVQRLPAIFERLNGKQQKLLKPLVENAAIHDIRVNFPSILEKFVLSLGILLLRYQKRKHDFRL